MSEKISWLASYPKSGSTWVRMFLNAYISRFPVNINTAFQYSSSDNDPALLQMLCPLSLTTMTVVEQFAYRSAMLLNMIKMSRTTGMCLKTHNAKIAVDGFSAIPLALSNTAIYLIRDPRDVCVSLSHHLGYKIDQTIEFMNNVKQGIVSDNNITDLILTWSQHVKSWTVKNSDLSCLCVKYEDLLLDPKNVFGSILAHLELHKLRDYDERVEFALKESSFTNLQKYENQKGFVEKGQGRIFFRSGKAGQWKTKLSSEQAYKIVEDHGEIMKEFNYA